MDEILEVIFEFIVEGLIEFSTGLEVPKPIQIACRVLVTGVCMAVSIGCAYIAITGDTNTVGRVILLIVSLAMLIGGIAFLRKVSKECKKQKSQERIEL